MFWSIQVRVGFFRVGFFRVGFFRVGFFRLSFVRVRPMISLWGLYEVS